MTIIAHFRDTAKTEDLNHYNTKEVPLLIVDAHIGGFSPYGGNNITTYSLPYSPCHSNKTTIPNPKICPIRFKTRDGDEIGGIMCGTGQGTDVDDFFANAVKKPFLIPNIADKDEPDDTPVVLRDYLTRPDPEDVSNMFLFPLRNNSINLGQHPCDMMGYNQLGIGMITTLHGTITNHDIVKRCSWNIPEAGSGLTILSSSSAHNRYRTLVDFHHNHLPHQRRPAGKLMMFAAMMENIDFDEWWVFQLTDHRPIILKLDSSAMGRIGLHILSHLTRHLVDDRETIEAIKNLFPDYNDAPVIIELITNNVDATHFGFINPIVVQCKG